MSVIRVQHLAGPQRGLWTTLDNDQIAFGRTADNAIAIDVAHVSRRHGELLFDGSEWLIANHSPNGTTVNGRTIAGDRPHALRSGDVIGVGKTKLFSVQFSIEEQGVEASVGEDAPKPQEKRKLSRRAKLYIGIAIWWVIIIGAAIVLTLPGGPASKGPPLPPQLTDQQIADEIRAPITQPLDARKSAEHLDLARTGYSRTEASPDGLYQTHRNYKLALAYSGKTQFDGLDQLSFTDVQTKLIDKVITDYRAAFDMVRGRNWASAEPALRALSAAYPDTDSTIFKNVQALLTVTLRNRPKPKMFGK